MRPRPIGSRFTTVPALGVDGVSGPGSFSFRGLKVAPPGPAPADPGVQRPGPAQDPIRELLRSLRGREVLLQVGDRLIAGKLVTCDPVLLVDGEGRSTLVRLEAIQAVTF